MKKAPTYTAAEIKEMCLRVDAETYRIIIQIIDEEIDLYEPEEVELLMQASMIMFTKSLSAGTLKNLNK